VILGQVFGADRMSIAARLRAWYRGPFVPRENDADPMLVFTGGEHKQPALAKALGVLARFWLNHWKWIIGTALAVALAVYAKHRS